MEEKQKSAGEPKEREPKNEITGEWDTKAFAATFERTLYEGLKISEKINVFGLRIHAESGVEPEKKVKFKDFPKTWIIEASVSIFNFEQTRKHTKLEGDVGVLASGGNNSKTGKWLDIGTKAEAVFNVMPGRYIPGHTQQFSLFIKCSLQFLWGVKGLQPAKYRLQPDQLRIEPQNPPAFSFGASYKFNFGGKGKEAQKLKHAKLLSPSQ